MLCVAGQAAEGRLDMFLLVSRQLVDSLPEDPFQAVLTIISEFRHAMSAVTEAGGDKALQDRKRYQIALEVCSLLSVYLKREGFNLTPPQCPYEYGQSAEEQRRVTLDVVHFVNELASDIQAQRRLGQSEFLEQAFDAALGPAVLIEFAEQELYRIWDLLASLRGLVSISPHLKPPHRRRLLQRIERLVGEFRQETHDVSLFWGFVVEMSLLFRPGSEDAYLLAPPMKELTRIVWSAQAKAFGLPPTTPFKLLGQDP
jgi:hypothetical protein